MSNTLPLMEDFYSIQGEGFFQGNAAYFIRLAGCNVGCHWCDVKESWDKSIHPLVSVEEIVTRASVCPSRRIVITGGEPFMYDLGALTEKLHEFGFRIHIETSGVYPPSGEIDWICFSPKKFKTPLKEFYAISHELKVVIYHPSDFLWAEKHAKKMHENGLFFLQPEWEKQKRIIPLITDYVKRNPKWKISLQTHKFMEIQ